MTHAPDRARREGIGTFAADNLPIVIPGATCWIGFAAGLIWAAIRRSWTDLGYAGLFLVIAIFLTLFLYWVWGNPRPKGSGGPSGAHFHHDDAGS